MKKHPFLTYLLLPLLLTISVCANAQAELLVIVHRDSSLTTLTREQVRDIYLGRLTGQQQNEKLQALDVNSDELRTVFYRALTGKPLAQIDAYWARLQFGGQQKSPRKLSNQHAILQSISVHPYHIGFIEANQLPRDSKIKVVLRLE